MFPRYVSFQRWTWFLSSKESSHKDSDADNYRSYHQAALSLNTASQLSPSVFINFRCFRWYNRKVDTRQTSRKQSNKMIARNMSHDFTWTT